MRISVRISSGASAVLKMPVKNCSIGIVRSPSGPSPIDLGAEREHRGRMIVGRIGVREVAADGRAVAHQRIRDHAAPCRGESGTST